MTWKLVIPKWQPAVINKFVGYHWSTMARLKRVDRNMICGYVKLNRFPLAQGPRQVDLLITLGPKQRAPDPDAFWKSTLDSLVHAQMLINDNRQYCRLGNVDFERGTERGTTIVLTEL